MTTDDKQIRFNGYRNRVISLREGESFCKRCNGKGVMKRQNKYNIVPFKRTKYLTCSECLGDGKLDWIEQATGKPKLAITGTDTYSPRSPGAGRP